MVFPLVDTSSTITALFPSTDPKLLLMVPSTLSLPERRLLGCNTPNEVGVSVKSSMKSAINVANGIPLAAIPSTMSTSPCSRATSANAIEINLSL